MKKFNVLESNVILLVEQSFFMRILTNSKYYFYSFDNVAEAQEFISHNHKIKNYAIFVNQVQS